MLKSVLKTLTLFIAALAGIAACVFFVFYYYGRSLPGYQYLKDYQPAMMSRLYANDLQPLKEFAKERRIFVPIDTMPPLLIKAFLVAEDKNFYSHPGVDPLGLLRAFIKNTIRGHWGANPTGASTITQQVAKNFLIGNERSLARKVKEAIMSVRLESALSKNRLLELYLNEIYLGLRSYGVGMAALTYFDKKLDDLTLSECAFLASLPKAPSNYHPLKEQKKAKERRDWVIHRLAEEAIITNSEAATAQQEPLTITSKELPMVQADYFADEVRRELGQKFGDKAIFTKGFRVLTTLDPALQGYAEKSLRLGLADYDKRHHWRGPVARINVTDSTARGPDSVWARDLGKIPAVPGMQGARLAVVLTPAQTALVVGFKNGEISALVNSPFKGVLESLSMGDVVLVAGDALFQIPEVTGGIVVMDANTGHVLALSGGYDYAISQFNCATQARRQPGSAFKPFVYLAALERGYTRDTIIDDAPVNVSLGRGMGVYSPQNITKQSNGPCPLYQGVEFSRNQMTVRLAMQIGMRAVQNIAYRFNITDYMPLQLAMALGAGGTTLTRLTAAYATIVNGGKKITPIYCHQVENWKGEIVYEPHNGDEQIIDADIAQTMTDILQGVVERGTARRLLPLAQELDIVLGGKTGSTNDYKDAWFIGFVRTKDGRTLLIGTFVGFFVPKSLGEGETGSRVALPIFESFVRDLEISKLNSK
ncbi:MAG: PBP1A family penicillin-binding protein [Alphaproteobacteria bacterium]|nr:PBP1A family penicillin-binding protein [Alphaproteobacteria bacterium]